MSKLVGLPRRSLFREPSVAPAETVANADLVANSDKPKVANKHGKYVDLAKRREYMRQYMAKKRAKK